MAITFLSLGSNLGNRGKNLQKALVDLEMWGIKSTLSSSIYETEPVGFKDQPWFYNMVVKTETKLSPEEVLKAISTIEKSLGRERNIRFGPRPIDIDILFYKNLLVHEKGLTIPHPRLQERLFVLMPLNEIEPHVLHPLLKKPISELLKECSDTAIVKRL